ncbi:hypothetical protein FRB94_003147 [Tulasnella sp. JGI-2019a]|nr:hypothetical protein FRB94_003147 [Tulasnella sp. JGI-2019a]
MPCLQSYQRPAASMFGAVPVLAAPTLIPRVCMTSVRIATTGARPYIAVRGFATDCTTSITTMAPLITTQTTLSLLFRLLTWIHLRVQPIEQPAVLILPAIFAVWLIAWVLERVPAEGPKVVQIKEENGPIANGHGVETVVIQRARRDPVPAPVRILFSLPSNLSVIRIIHVLINLTLALFLYDHLAQSDPPADAPHSADVIFARVGAVYPDSVKIQVRYPNLMFEESFLSPTQQAGVGMCKVLWREAVTGSGESTVGMWKDGPVLQLAEGDDWVGVAHVEKLWPSTSYQFRLAYPNSTFLPYPEKPLPFKTFPDPRLNQGSKFKFVASSGIRPNYPYEPLDLPHKFKGLDLLANYYLPSPACSSSCSVSSSAPSITPNAVIKDHPAPEPIPFDEVSGTTHSGSVAASAGDTTATETCPYHGYHHPTAPVHSNPRQTDVSLPSKTRLLWTYIRDRVVTPEVKDVTFDSPPNFMVLVGGLDTTQTSYNSEYGILSALFRRYAVDDYLKSYRGLYASSAFRTLYECIPVFSILGAPSHLRVSESIPASFGQKLADWLDSKFKSRSLDSAPELGQALEPSVEQAYETYAGRANYARYGVKGLHYSFGYADSAFFVLDTISYRSSGPEVVPCDKMVLGESQMLDLWLWAAKVNATSTFKFIVSPLPLTSLWPSSSSWSTCSNSERKRLIDLLAYIPNVIVISGGRHAFAAVEYHPPDVPIAGVADIPKTSSMYEFVVGPLSGETALQWDHPQNRSVRWENVTAVIPITGFGEVVEHETVDVEIEREEEKLLEFVREGNHKWSAFSVDTLTNPERPTVTIELFSDGAKIWSFTVLGTYVPLLKATSGNAVGSTLRGGIRNVLDKMGLNPAGWFRS